MDKMFKILVLSGMVFSSFFSESATSAPKIVKHKPLKKFAASDKSPISKNNVTYLTSGKNSISPQYYSYSKHRWRRTACWPKSDLHFLLSFSSEYGQSANWFSFYYRLTRRHHSEWLLYGGSFIWRLRLLFWTKICADIGGRSACNICSNLACNI